MATHFVDSTFSFIFFVTCALRKPRMLWFCQSVAFAISARVAPWPLSPSGRAEALLQHIKLLGPDITPSTFSRHCGCDITSSLPLRPDISLATDTGQIICY